MRCFFEIVSGSLQLDQRVLIVDNCLESGSTLDAHDFSLHKVELSSYSLVS
jgi:adenine/guanine phosphoribosyltransferase-like PRPP-binding protein